MAQCNMTAVLERRDNFPRDARTIAHKFLTFSNSAHDVRHDTNIQLWESIHGKYLKDGRKKAQCKKKLSLFDFFVSKKETLFPN